MSVGETGLDVGAVGAVTPSSGVFGGGIEGSRGIGMVEVIV